ncbi:MAG: hypothetical protein ACQETL_04855 [Bacteroidota bacterium]
MSTDFSNQHSVLVHFMYYKEELDELHELDDKLDKVINENGVGQYDWHEINMDMSDGTLFMHGPNAEELFKTIKPILEETDFTQGAWAVLRFGGLETDASEIEFQIGE